MDFEKYSKRSKSAVHAAGDSKLDLLISRARNKPGLIAGLFATAALGTVLTVARFFSEPQKQVIDTGDRIDMPREAHFAQLPRPPQLEPGEPQGDSLPPKYEMAREPDPAYFALPVATRADRLFKAVIFNESKAHHFRPDGRVRTGKGNMKGFGQIAPKTGKELAREMNIPRRSVLDPKMNLQMSRHLFDRHWNDFDGITEMILLAYNGGVGKVRDHIKKVGDPREGKISATAFGRTSVSADYIGHIETILQGQAWERLHPEEASLLAMARHPKKQGKPILASGNDTPAPPSP